MACKKKLRKKVMDKVRREYPRYSLKRRRKIVNSIIYRKMKGGKK